MSLMPETLSVKRRGSNPGLGTDISQAMGHADGIETENHKKDMALQAHSPSTPATVM
jgi:hypothetical protein